MIVCHRALFFLVFTAAALGAASVRAQCADWDDRFAGIGVAGDPFAFTVFDDGSGDALYVGGGFTTAGGSGSPTLNHVAKWTGAGWMPLGVGVNGTVYALAGFDDGSGPALYAAGSFTTAGGAPANRIARWNGASWSALGSGIAGGVPSVVNTLAVFDDGTGSALYVGGHFTSAGGVPATGHIAKWSGSTWSSVGGGVDDTVHAFARFDSGTGPLLYAAGAFENAGGVAAKSIAAWDGASWSSLGSGLDNFATALCVFDAGSGDELYVAGAFSLAGGAFANRIAKWDGAGWSSLGSGPDAPMKALHVFDDGTGPALYAAGDFSSIGGMPFERIAKWDGTNWSELLSGAPGEVWALEVFDFGAGAKLVAGGAFISMAGSFVNHIATWDGAHWSGIGGHGLGNLVRALEVFNDGSVAQLYAGGDFTTAGLTAANHIARWDGADWFALGSGVNGIVFALAVFDDGNGPALYAGGNFTSAGGVSAGHIARWDGANWSALGSGIGRGSASVTALAVYDDGSGPALYVGGGFNTAGSMPASSIAKWNGSAWSSLGSGVTAGVSALTVYDDGLGPALLVGGSFSTAGGMAAPFIAKWIGGGWQPVPGGLNAPVTSLAVFDDGAGIALYAGGSFTDIGGSPYGRIAKWDGSNWSALGSGLSHNVYALTVFDDGAGEELYASGDFTTAGGAGASRIAKWNGASWSALGSGLTSRAQALRAHDDGTDGAPDLYAGGAFGTAGGTASSFIAEWHGCEPGTTYCFGDGIDSVVTAQCPCGNFGEPGRGCANSNASLGGARLWASGSTSPNTLVFHCEGMPNNSLATVMRGSLNNPGGVVFHDGVQCIAGAIIRFGQQTVGQDGNPPFTMAAPAIALAPGQTRYYQVHYRNPNAGFCPPGQFNFSNGYVVTW